jgi:hypothetical protein
MHNTRKALLASLLVSTAVVLGQALAGVPNVELMTITVFVSGYLLGWRLGMVVGSVSIALHSLFNPLGAALPPLLGSQVAAFAMVGLAGASIGPLILVSKRRWIASLAGGVVGCFLTLLYDLLTNVGAFFSITGNEASSGFVKFVAAGMLFTAMHVAWNTALFSVVLVPVLSVLTGFRVELQGGDR